MKDSSQWIRQPKVDKAGDDVVTERECHPNEVKPNWVAKKLGVELNGALIEKVLDWRRRRSAEKATLTIDVPPQAEADFREQIDVLGVEAVQIFRRTVRIVCSELDHAANLRISNAERRADQAEVDRDEVLVLCRQAEERCTDMETRLADLQQQVEDTRRENDRLLGRLEQREIDGPRQDAPSPIKGSPDLSKPRSDMAQRVDALVNGPPNEPEVEADDVATGATDAVELIADAVDEQEQPSDITAGRPTGGQVEMPLDTDDDANEMDVRGDDYG